jgi:hypothetical protein
MTITGLRKTPFVEMIKRTAPRPHQRTLARVPKMIECVFLAGYLLASPALEA